ncbi:MAG: hypothetical protein KNU04_gp32 [crAssphage sp. isolate ctbg_1]|uniref:Uncharacterized protein n=1 Tax=crAssphage sp. isolate ctbg_1 TaxID=2989854 RepID=A0A345MSZ9_9CAUD|nr:MAG: hypothetical protein KNU04_gp32 [crAssphage sp. isolate ctbg_1]AXH74499.1 MAG: hypothetical protein [crAssphage sp. isolate ctbg_1]
MGLLTTEHLTKIINKVKSLVFGTNNIEDGAITKAKIDSAFINEITAAKTDTTNLKNIVIFLPENVDLSNIEELDITNNIGLYVTDINSSVGDHMFLRKFDDYDFVNIAFNGCTVTIKNGTHVVGFTAHHFNTISTAIDNGDTNNTQILQIQAVLNMVQSVTIALIRIECTIDSINDTTTYTAKLITQTQEFNLVKTND